MCLTLIKEPSYPQPKGAAPDPPPVLQDARVRPARPDDLVLLARYLPVHHPPDTFPPDFRLPGKVIDMVASGEYRWVVGVDGQGHIGGGLAWRFVRPSTAECFGPYLVHQPEDSPLAEAWWRPACPVWPRPRPWASSAGTPRTGCLRPISNRRAPPCGPIRGPVSAV